MAADRTQYEGPTWADVRLMMKEVGGAHNVRVDVHMTSAMGVDRSESMVWTVRAWQWGKWGEGNPYHFTSGTYPTSQWRTVPAMLYNLLHRLDGEMTSLQEERRAQRGPRLPGME